MKLRPLETVASIAAFLGIELTGAQQRRILEATSPGSMCKFNDKFYPVPKKMRTAPGGKIIRKGAVGEGRWLFFAPAIARFRDASAGGFVRENSGFPHFGLQSMRPEPVS